MPHRDRPARIPWSVCETQTRAQHAQIGRGDGRVCWSPLTARPGDTKLARRHRRSMLPRSAAAPAAAPARLRRRAAVAASSHLIFTPLR